MKEQIEQQLQKLTGLQLTKSTRAANMECLKFGRLLQTSRRGQELEIGEFGLHLQSPWRFTSDTKILVGSLDLFEPINDNIEYDENFDWDKPNGNLRDAKLQELIKTQELVVSSWVADHFGGFDLLFNNQVKLSLLPCTSKIGEYSELWRLLDNRETSKNHFVVTTSFVRID